MTFAEPYYLLLIALLAPIIWLSSRRRISVGHSQLGIHARMHRYSWLRITTALIFCLAWSAACVALSRPLLLQSQDRQAVQTRDFVIQLDISGSMGEPIEGARPTAGALAAPSAGPVANSAGGATDVSTRITAARTAVSDFIRRREGDRVALLLFNSESFYAWPLSRDHSVVLRRLEQVTRYVTGGTNFDSENGAMQGAIEHFREMAQAETRVLVLVTDGEASMDPARTRALAAQLSDLRIRVYVLGVGPSWANNGRLTQDLRQLVEAVGGTVIPIANDAQMRSAFATIDQMERSTIEIERNVTHREMYALLAILAVFALLAYVLLSAVILEEV